MGSSILHIIYVWVVIDEFCVNFPMCYDFLGVSHECLIA